MDNTQDSYGSAEDIRYNLRLFFIDGLTFPPSMALINMTTVIPFFLYQLGASTFQLGLVASLAMICTFMAQPFFGSMASKVTLLHKTFGKILLLQRLIFLAFILSIPLFAEQPDLLVWLFLLFWAIFHIFVASYGVFFAPLVLKLLPPDKRGGFRGIGLGIGSLLGLGLTALMPTILGAFIFPNNFMVVFLIGICFLMMNARVFATLRELPDSHPRIPMGVGEYISNIPLVLKKDGLYRAIIIMCSFLMIANSLLAYYTLYAIQVFDATEAYIAILAAIAIITSAFGHVVFGRLIDKAGPVVTVAISAVLIALAGTVALSTNTLNMLFIAWMLANLGNICYAVSAILLLGEIGTGGRLPLYVGILNIVSLSLSAIVVILLAPILETIGFTPLFLVVLACGLFGLFINLLVVRRRVSGLRRRE